LPESTEAASTRIDRGLPSKVSSGARFAAGLRLHWMGDTIRLSGLRASGTPLRDYAWHRETTVVTMGGAGAGRWPNDPEAIQLRIFHLSASSEKCQ